MGQRTALRRALARLEGEAGRPRGACGISGCKLPWRDHFTKAKTLRKEFKDHYPADWQAERDAPRKKEKK